MKTKIGQQGEVAIYQIDKLPDNITTIAVEKSPLSGAAIVSHSEKGNHHVVQDGEVLERTNNVPTGMRILYAIVKDPTSIVQEATTAHGEIALGEGVYEFRISREFDPFAEEIRQVAD